MEQLKGTLGNELISSEFYNELSNTDFIKGITRSFSELLAKGYGDIH